MEITTHDDAGVIVFKIAGRLDAEHAEQMKQLFKKHLAPNMKAVFDLQELEYLDSTGLGAIVYCLKQCNENQGKLKLANLVEPPRMILEVTRAYLLFDIYDSTEQAVASFDR